MVNGIGSPLIVKKFVKKNRKFNQYGFLQMLPKSSWTTFKLIFENLSALGGCRVTIIGGVFDFRGFLRISRRLFLYFFVKSFSIARSDLVEIKTDILIMGALFTLETRHNVPIFAGFRQKLLA